MLKKTLLCTVALASIPTLAHADPRSDLESDMTTYLSWISNTSWTVDAAASAPAASDCDAAIAKAKKRKVADDAQLELGYAADVAKLVPEATAGPHNGSMLIQVKDASKICEAYATAVAYQPLRAAVEAGYKTAAWMKDVTPDEASGIQGLSKQPQACLDAIGKMTKLGMSDADTITLSSGDKPTLAEARDTCTYALEDAQKFEGTVTARETAEHDEIEAIYKKVGIKGKRLALFTYNGKPEDGSFLAKGCTKYVTTAKALKKAKKLFQWAEKDDGTIVVTTFKFKGDNYTATSKEYALPENAYRGCK